MQDVSLEIRTGEFVAVMVPSGGGKCTMLHILRLLDQPSGGSHYFEGQEVTRLTDGLEVFAVYAKRIIRLHDGKVFV